MNLSSAAAEEPNPPIAGRRFQGAPEEIERRCASRSAAAVADSMAQLTAWAVLMGARLGAVPSLTNLSAQVGGQLEVERAPSASPSAISVLGGDRVGDPGRTHFPC